MRYVLTACLPDYLVMMQAQGRSWRLQIASGGCKRSRPGAGEHCMQLCVWQTAPFNCASIVVIKMASPSREDAGTGYIQLATLAA